MVEKRVFENNSPVDYETAQHYTADPKDEVIYVETENGKLVKGDDGKTIKFDSKSANIDLLRPDVPAHYEKRSYIESMDWIKVMRDSGLENTISEENARTNRSRAIEAAKDYEYAWAGQKPYNFITSTIVKTRRKVLQEYGIQDPNKATEEAKQEIIERVKGQLCGMSGERIASKLPVAEVTTDFINTDSRNVDALKGIGSITEITDVTELFGGTQKDKLVSGFVIADSLGKHLNNKIENITFEEWIAKHSSSEGETLTPETASKIAETIMQLHLNYNKMHKMHARALRSTNEDAEESIYEQYVLGALQKDNKEKSELTESEKKAIRLVTNYGYKESGRHGDVSAFYAERIESELDVRKRPKDGKPDNSVAQELFDLSYPETTVPDAVLKTKEGKIAAVVEVKAYTQQEIDELIRLLTEQTDENSSEIVFTNGVQAIVTKTRAVLTPVTFSRKDIREGGRDSTILDVDEKGKLGVTVNTGGFVTESRTYGPPIKAEQNFARMAGAESDNVPVIVRLPENISKESIKELNYLSQKAGLKNVVWQRLPVTRKEIEETSRIIAWRARTFANKYNFGGVKGANSKLDRDILETLGNVETWESN